jgi:hypothetical protein
MKKLCLAFSVCLISFISSSNAQILGCTDPLATNYNASATQNDGSCIYNSASVSPVSSVTLGSSLTETSGLIKWDDHIWTHNDNNDLNLYSLDTLNGNVIQTYALNGVVNNDWEEISQDSNYVYVGDFGNNSNGNRTNLKILRIEKNSLLLNTPVIDTINFSYSNQVDFTPAGSNNTDFDCEAFIVSSDSIFLFTKQWVSNSTSVYSLSKTPGTYVANLRSTLNAQGLVTGATYQESKRLIVLCGYSSLLQPFIYLLYDFQGTDFFNGNKRKISISLPFHQVEGIATTNGLKYYISNEYFTQPPFITNPQKLHILDFSSYLSGYLNSLTVSVSETGAENNFSLYPNPAERYIILKSGSEKLPSDYLITDSSGKIVLKGKITKERSIIGINELSSGIYVLRLGQKFVQTFKVIKN